MTAEAAGSATGVELLDRAVAYTLGSLTLVEPRMLPFPTPCSRWDLRSLLWHVDESLTALCEATGTGVVALGIDTTSPGPHAHDPVEAVKANASRLLARCADGTGPGVVRVGGHHVDASVVATTGALEIAVHGWDVARACGHDRPLPSSFAADLLELAQLLVGGADRPARFAAPIGVTAGGPSDRLVAFLGRVP